MPAWLQSLRAGERLPAGATGPIPLSAADLIDEESLPSWMRAEQKEDTAEYQFPGSAQFGGPADYAAAPPARGIAARSLIDEQALPSWMREGQGQEGAGAREGGLSGQKDIPASSLVEPEALPEWMKSLGPSTLGSAGTEPSAREFSRPTASEWGQVAGAQPGLAPAPGQPLQAHDLIDPQQLPDWLRGQHSPTEAVTRLGAPGAGGATRLEAASLIDMNALPAWLREGQLQNADPRPASPSPGGQGGPVAPPPAPSLPAGGLTAASLIDMNALPEWLRSSMETPAPAGSSGQNPMTLQEPGRTLPDPMQPRVENMRVPSRPRTELGVSEQSEAAANVFASLLGVASAAPSLPAQGADPRYGQGAPISPSSAPAAGGVMPAAPAAPPGYPATYIGASASANPAPAASAYAAPPPSASPPGPGAEAHAQSRAQAQARPAKRSFLDVIRSWFPH
ncbi:MAG: hypothetical protein IMW90_07985 [Thermogemmatispora sp.]|uniref:hypothetical protein n=1 Tax=Thermogemmatispora sp. TaxID=1968838 RepID=UPI0019DCC789|nr:hypothetical protein [Thermogemmatispora sp.]MBE3565656.1 hypothetical protein [Thermogemmatispora sp.]